MKLNESAFTIVIIFLGLTMLTSLAGIIGLAANSQPVPDELKVTLASVVAGMIGMLARTPGQPPPNSSE